MPSKNSIKQYVGGGYYHLYNRGVEKRIIFLDEQDYSVFLGYLKEYLMPKDTENLKDILSSVNSTWKERDKALKLLKLNNFYGEISLLAFCLMPNHFHLLIKQNNLDSIDKFMQSLLTRYTMFFNRKHKRVGVLFQDAYKAVLVTNDNQLLHLTRYIHKQSLVSQGDSLRDWNSIQPSSYFSYLGRQKTQWIQPQEVLSFFSKTNPRLNYQSFVSQTEDIESIQKLLLDE